MRCCVRKSVDTSRVFEVDPNTVLGWLVEAAEQLQAFSTYFLHDLHLTQVQLPDFCAMKEDNHWG